MLIRWNKMLMDAATDGGAGGGANGSANGGSGNSGGAAPGAGATPNIADGGGAPPAAQNNPAPSGGTNANTANTFLDSLPEEIRKDPSLQNFRDPAALAKSWVNAQKLVGADKLVMPGEKATNEEIAAFYTKLGRPAKAEDYKFEGLPDGYKIPAEREKAVRESLFNAGLTAKQASAVLALDAHAKAEDQKAYDEAQNKQILDNLTAYREKLGGDEKYRATVDSARLAVSSLVKNNEFKQFLVDSKLGSHPLAIEFFADLHKMMGEDKIRDGSGVNMSENDLSTLQRELSDIEGNADYWKGKMPNQEAMTTRRTDLNRRIQALRQAQQQHN